MNFTNKLLLTIFALQADAYFNFGEKKATNPHKFANNNVDTNQQPVIGIFTQ